MIVYSLKTTVLALNFWLRFIRHVPLICLFLLITTLAQGRETFPPGQTLAELAAVSEDTRDWLCSALNCPVDQLVFKSSTVCGVAHMPEENKFIKLHAGDGGIVEKSAGVWLQQYLPVVAGERVISLPPFQCLIQPYLPEINQPGGMLYDYFYLCPEEAIHLMKMQIHSVHHLVHSTLRLGVSRAPNDRLYWDRIGDNREASSRHVLQLYQNKVLLGTSWEQLVTKQWVIDGTSYRHPLQELLDQAKRTLSPENLRPLAICHGDWHDMNICVQNGLPYFLDCELAGWNDPIGDAAVFLIYCVVQGDYFGPKYHPAHFPHRDAALATLDMHRFPLDWSVQENRVHIMKAQHFGTSPVRKEAASLFVNTYFKPLLAGIHRLGIPEDQIEDRVRAALLMRLLCVYSLAEIAEDDQARLFALLVQSLCSDQPCTLDALLEHI